MFSIVKQYIAKFLNLFYPNACLCCSENLVAGELFLCIVCDLDLPVIPWSNENTPSVASQLKGKVNFESAYSLFYYSKTGKTGKLIKEIKYKGNKELGEYLGSRFGERLLTISSMNTVDFVLPVPLHKRRLLKRGFNQSKLIAQGVGAKLNIPVLTSLIKRVKYNVSQTKKGREGRLISSKGLFELVKTQPFEGKHILILDDVITTGATIESMFQALESIKNVKISVAALCSPYE